MSDLISREALKKTITEHCRTETECLNHFWYDENIIALIDNVPTEEAIANGFTRDELQSWLYKIVMNNMDGSEKDKVFADCVVEIIDRLDGFERYVEEKRREGEA